MTHPASCSVVEAHSREDCNDPLAPLNSKANKALREALVLHTVTISREGNGLADGEGALYTATARGIFATWLRSTGKGATLDEALHDMGVKLAVRKANR